MQRLRYSLEPEKVHPTGEFVIMVKSGGHVLHHLASRLVNVIRQVVGRQAGGWAGGQAGREGVILSPSPFFPGFKFKCNLQKGLVKCLYLFSPRKS